jgi:transcriptional regulator with GAF, ATPase, and Fis domain
VLAAPATPAPAEPPAVTPADPDAGERARVTAAIDAAGGNLSAAARALGLHRTQLYRVMDRLGLRRDTD